MEYFLVKALLITLILGCLYGVYWWKHNNGKLIFLIPISLWFVAAAVMCMGALSCAMYAVYWSFTFTGA